MANCWLRPRDANSTNNVLQFIESTLHCLGSKTVGPVRADSGFYGQEVFKLLEDRHIDYIISARLTQSLQQAIIRDVRYSLNWKPNRLMDYLDSSDQCCNCIICQTHESNLKNKIGSFSRVKPYSLQQGSIEWQFY